MTTGSIGPGTVLAGRYRLDDLLAESEGARFWRATDTILARSVADPRRARATTSAPPACSRRPGVSATVTDPHLLRVLDCDDEDGITWVVNEWGDGVSLDLMLQQGTLPPSRAAWLTREVADAIAAGHAQGVAHGRLNPEAVLVTHAGAVKLIGYVVDASLQPSPSPDSLYGEIDEREADVINLAGVLYAGLTGRWPGVAPSGVPQAPREGRRPLRPRQVRAGVPRTLDVICERVLHKEASQHAMPIETAHEIAAALADYLGDSGHGGPARHRRDARRAHRLDPPRRPADAATTRHRTSRGRARRTAEPTSRPPQLSATPAPGCRGDPPGGRRRADADLPARPGRVPTRWRRCTPRASPRPRRPRSRTSPERPLFADDRAPGAGRGPRCQRRSRRRRAGPAATPTGARDRPAGRSRLHARVAPATPGPGSGRSPTRTRPRTTSTPARRGAAGCAPRSSSACSSSSSSPWPSRSTAAARTARHRPAPAARPRRARALPGPPASRSPGCATSTPTATRPRRTPRPPRTPSTATPPRRGRP